MHSDTQSTGVFAIYQLRCLYVTSADALLLWVQVMSDIMVYKESCLMVPTIISTGLIIIFVVGVIILKTSTTLQLSDGEMVNSIIAIFACLGGLISATFVVYSYIRMLPPGSESRACIHRDSSGTGESQLSPCK